MKPISSRWLLDPSLYLAHHAHLRDDLDFWLGLASALGGPILELGCGTGRISLPLAEAGHTVCGLDLDRGMLRLLQSLVPGTLRERVWILQADMTAFRLASRFPLILLPCNTLSTLTASARSRLLRCVCAHLSPDGLFVASLPNPSILAQVSDRGETELEEIIIHPQSGYPVQVSSAWTRSEDRVTIHWHYDHLHPDGQVARLTISCSHELVPIGVHRDEYATAGLRLIETYGDFDRVRYTPEAPYLILVAKIH